MRTPPDIHLTLYESLRAAGVDGIPRAELRRRAKASLRELDGGLAELQRRGFRLVEGGSPGTKARALVLMAEPAGLHELRLRLGMHLRRLTGPWTCAAQTASTNDLAWEHLHAHDEDGAVFLAEHQTAGRGRWGRSWASAPGLGLWFSVALRPKLPRERFTVLTALSAVAIVDGLRE